MSAIVIISSKNTNLSLQLIKQNPDHGAIKVNGNFNEELNLPLLEYSGECPTWMY